MAEPLRIGLIGCGGMMGGHVKGFQELWNHGYQDFRIAACCDQDRSRAEKLAADSAEFQREKPALYENVDEMLEKEAGMAAVDISTEHRSHHTIACACFEAGKHVTIEKPIAITIRAAHKMIDAAEEKALILHIAENYRRSHAERAINWAVKTGRIGKVRMVFWIDVNERLHPWGWRDHREIAGGGWSMDGGVHFADLFRYHVGEVEEMVAYSRAFHPLRYRDGEKMKDPVPATVEDTTMALLKFANGALGQWTSTTTAPKHPFSDRVIYGENGSIRWGVGLESRTGKLTMDELIELHQSSISPEAKGKLFPCGISSQFAPLSFELHEFVESVLRGGPVEIDGVEGMKDLALSLAIYESEVAGTAVRIEDIESGKIAEYQRQFDQPLGLA
jgi:1,5-anhydro-D-fructose reductase (1,5-anhydro-D-mannitol-forming)